jgi:hypothetical protein
MTIDLTTIDWKVILGSIAILVTLFGLFYFQWWRNRKRFSYEVLSNVSLVTTSAEVQDDVEILYKSKPVKNVRLLIIKLINDGFLPIKKDDFDNFVRITFPDGMVISTEKVLFHPSNLDTSIRHEDNWVEVDPALFNRKDYIQLKILVSSNLPLFNVTARIVGVSKIEKVRDNFLLPIISGSFVGSIVTVLALLFTPPPPEGRGPGLVFLVWVMLSGACFAVFNTIKTVFQGLRQRKNALKT